MSALIWVTVGVALWHFTVFIPDRFWGGIIGAFLLALAGGIASGWLLPTPGFPSDNPPGVSQALYALPGAVLVLAVSYWYGSRREP